MFYGVDGILIDRLVTSPGSGVFSVAFGHQTEDLVIAGISITNLDFNGVGFTNFVLQTTDTITGDNGDEIPEPATILLLASGLVGLAGFRRKRRK